MTEAPDSVIIINSAVAVANWLIDKNRTDPSDLTPLKLQKILYFAQGWHLAYFDYPLFEEPIEAWKYGPVVSSIYFALSSRIRNEVITEPIKGPIVHDGVYSEGIPEMKFPDADSELFMQSVWKTFSKKKAWELVSMTHINGSPWKQVVNSRKNKEFDTDSEWYGESHNAIIPIDLMRSHFKAIKDQSENS
jgi:uncharacterized phage-associated protein